MTTKYIEICSTSVFIKQMKMKIIMKYHFTLALLKGWTTHMMEEIVVTGDQHDQWKYKRTNWKLKTTKQTEISGSSPENV